MSINITGRRTRNIIDKQAVASAFVQGGEWYRLMVSPRCPPDKTLYVRGGLVYCGYYGAAYADYNNRAYTIPSLVADLEDQNSVGVSISFDTVNWYKLTMLLLALPAEIEEPTVDDWSFYLYETGDEFETAGEAEAWFSSEDFRLGDPWSGERGYPLCGVVLRNDGSVGTAGSFMPIDAVNRGRSYLWPKDVRPRKWLRF